MNSLSPSSTPPSPMITALTSCLGCLDLHLVHPCPTCFLLLNWAYTARPTFKVADLVSKVCVSDHRHPLAELSPDTDPVYERFHASKRSLETAMLVRSSGSFRMSSTGIWRSARMKFPTTTLAASPFTPELNHTPWSPRCLVLCRMR